MVVGIEEFSRKTPRYMELAEKIDLYVVDQSRSVVWHIHCWNGFSWDCLADGLAGWLGNNTSPQFPLQVRMACCGEMHMDELQKTSEEISRFLRFLKQIVKDYVWAIA